MRHNTPELRPYTKPIFEALTHIQRHIAREDSLQLIVAAATRQQLTRLHWPAHVKIAKGKKLGRRVPARGSRRILVAFWPDDHYEATRQASLIYVLRGQAHIGIADYQLQCQVGDFILLPQDIPRSTATHIPTDNPQAQCDLLWIRPSEGNRMDCWICHSHYDLHESGPHYGACFVENAMLVRQFMNLNEEAQGNNDAQIMHHFLTGIILLFKREMTVGKAFLPLHHLHEDVQDGVSAKAGDPIKEACSYIDAHLDKPLTSTWLAHHVCISRTLFLAKFQQSQNQTFHQYLTKHRLAKAVALLRESDVPVKIIATMVGLRYSQLRRLFLQHYQCTPGEFRRQSAMSGSP